MLHWLQHPAQTDIADYIECYWFIEKQSESESYQYPKLNPDPSAHLIISPSQQNYHYDMNPGTAKGTGSHLLYPHKKTLQLDHSQPFVHLGIKFHIGALYSLFSSSSQRTLLDHVTPIRPSSTSDDDLLSINTATNDLVSSELILEGFDGQPLIKLARENPQQCCNQLDTLLQPWLSNTREDQHSQLTRKALKAIDTSTISQLSSLLYCSQRTLERSFSRVTGLTLKQCQSMRKLEAMLEYLYQRESNDIDWVEVAFRFGFSDQPHLIRHLKKELGITPTAYEKERGLTIDVYGGVSSN